MGFAQSGAMRPASRGPRKPPPPPAPPARRDAFLPVALALTLAWGVLFAPQIFGGRVFVAGDWPTETPFSEFSLAHWRATHERALWNPYVMLGVPAAASLADSRPQWLPDPALDALAGLPARPVWPGLALPLLAHLAGMLALAALARALWSVGAWAAATAGLAYGLLPNLLVPFAWGHHAQLVSEGLLPVALLLVHTTFARATRGGAALAALALAAVLALQVAAGHPQYTYYALALAAAFAIERARAHRRVPRLAAVGTAFALALGMSAATWAPMLAYGADSVRAFGGGPALAEIARYSLAPRDFVTLAWAGAMGFGDPTYWGGLAGTDFPLYSGLLVIALAVAGLGARRREGRAVLLLAGTAAAGLVLALGTRLGPALDVLRAALPYFASIRVAVATLVLTQLALALLAARGAERLLAHAPPKAASTLAAIAGALVAAALLALALAGPFEGAWMRAALAARPLPEGKALAAAAHRARLDLVVHLALAAAGLGALAAAIARRLPAAWAAPALALLVACDVGGVSWTYVRNADGPLAAITSPRVTPLLRALERRPGQRACAMETDSMVRTSAAITARVRDVGGVHGTPLLPWMQVVATGLFRATPVQRALAVSVIEAPRGIAIPDTVYERLPDDDGPSALWALRRTLPRAHAVGHVIAVAGDGEAMNIMAGTEWDPATAAVTTEAGLDSGYPGSAGCTLLWRDDAPDHQVIEVTAPAPAFVVVADAWDRGWHATIDGAPARIARVDHLLRGIAVPAGTHRVAFAYRPPWWNAGVRAGRITFGLWAVLLGAALVLRFRDRYPSGPMRARNPLL